MSTELISQTTMDGTASTVTDDEAAQPPSQTLERCIQQLFEITGRHIRHCHHISELDIYAQLETLRAMLCQLDPTLTLPPDLVSDIDKVLTHRSNHSLLTPSSSIPPRITISHTTTAGTQPQPQKQTRISLWKGDITTLTGVSAIVNAANTQLLGCFQPSHRCIDNVIHSAAGPRLRRACYALMQAENRGYEEPSGLAKVTPGFNLHARYVIHTVGPELDGGRDPDEDDCGGLRECYVSCLEAAEVLEPLEDGRKVLVFCCISTGLFAFPSDVAARIALDTVIEWCVQHPETTITDVVFDTFLERDWDLYNENMATLPMKQTNSSAMTIHSNLAEPPHPLTPNSIRTAKSWLLSADYLIISAGAGLSAATGLDYTSPTLFAKHFPAFLLLDLRRLYDVFGFDRWESPEQKWGYYFHHLDMVRNWPESPLYGSLREIAEGFGTRCFVRTSNADGFFVLNGFHPSRISTPQGQYAILQCFAKCRREAVFPSAPFIDAALPFLDTETQSLMDSSKIPACKYCGGELSICVRGGDYFNSSPFKAQEREYKRFIEHVSSTIDTSPAEADGGAGPKAVILELGVGMNTPSVLRWANDELIEESASRGFRLIRAGLDAAGCAPWNLEEEGLAVGINGDLNEVIWMLGQK
jgi:O-acetyl-ADP-ribose deacetylase (regulator of RNase III)/NAD-dependent SIR2 family protein deacetylase